MSALPSLFFTTTIEHSSDLAEVLRGNGIRVYPISGQTPDREELRFYRMFEQGAIDGLASCGVLCLDEQTEILTDHGWTAIDQMTYSHLVANWDAGGVFFKQPKYIVIRQRLDGERMVSLKCQDFDIRVTEDHRMLYRTHRVARAPFLLAHARSLVGRSFQVPVSGIMDHNNGIRVVVDQPEETSPRKRRRRVISQAFDLRKRSGMDRGSSYVEAERRVTRKLSLKHKQPNELSVDDCRFIGFWVGDGSVNHLIRSGVEYTLSQSSRYPVAIEWVRGVLSRMGVDNIERHKKAPPGDNTMPYITWSVPRGTGGGSQQRSGIFYLEPYLQKNGTNLWWGFSCEQFNAFLEGLWLADGDHGVSRDTLPPSFQISGTAERKCLSIVQAIAVCHGYYANLKTSPSRKRGHAPLCRLFLKPCEAIHLATKHMQFEDDWKPERVWCVTSDTGCIITRRNGKVVVTGNTEGFDAPNAMAAFMTRPTKSGLLFRQMVGRVARPFPAPTGDRPYQQQCLDDILEDLQAGITLQLAVLPTGTGKTFLAAHLNDVVQRWTGRPCRRQLFLVHRDNLVKQAADTYQRWQPHMKVGIEAGNGRYAGDADVVVASVATLGGATANENDGTVTWNYNRRIAQFNPDDFDVVVCDEVHHAAKSQQYQSVFRFFRVLKGEPDLDRSKLLLGITATPNRSDNVGLESVCEKITFEYGLRDAIRAGYLADIHGYRVETSADISAVRTTAGDLNLAQLATQVNTRERNELVAREYLRIRDLVQPDILPGRKPYCIVVDFVDVSGRHSLITGASLFGLREKFDLEGQSAMGAAEEIEALEAANPGLDLHDQEDMEAVRRRLEQIRTELRRTNLLASPSVSPEVRAHSKINWLKDGENSYHLALKSGELLSIRQDTLGAFVVYQHNKGIRTEAGKHPSLGMALAQGDRLIPHEEVGMLKSDAAWRSGEPTEAQARAIMVVHRQFNREFHSNAQAFHRYALEQYRNGNPEFSRGGLSDEIHRKDAARR